jgi:2-polyprenyl-3-methyl-5-hydroxy-6-metoxy-1,4-benzoquinol methylase
MPEAADDVRFAFGRNWQSYVNKVLTPEREAIAEQSLVDACAATSISGRTFLDIGCGSGLFSLAAHRLGARVVSIDIDRASIACCRILWERAGRPESWQIIEGSILDREVVGRLPQADVVYSWGVLHHTGSMWEAMGSAAALVADGGTFCIAIYNNKEDRVGGSRMWWHIKRFYVSHGRIVQWIMEITFAAYRTARILVSLRNPFRVAREYQGPRGMDLRHDWRDWLGGFPYEYASAGEVFSFCRDLGFEPVRMQTTSTVGCNEFVFARRSSNERSGRLGAS